MQIFGRPLRKAARLLRAQLPQAASAEMDKTPDEPAGPSLGQIAMGTIPGAVIGMAASGLIGGAYDGVAAGRMVYGNEEFDGEKLMQSSPFLRRGGKK